MGEHAVAGHGGVHPGWQVDRPHGAAAADVGEAVRPRHRAQPGREAVTYRGRPVDQALGLQQADIGERGRARRRMPRVGAAVPQHHLRTAQRLVHGRAEEHPAERLVAAGDGLGERDDVGPDAEVARAEPVPQPPESGDHLVEDEERAMTVAQLAQPGEVARPRRVDATGTDHRLGDHRGDPAVVAGQHRAHRVQVVLADLDDVADTGAESLPVGR